LETYCRGLGFDWFGVAPAAELTNERQRLQEWLIDGRHGAMEWLARDPQRRSDPRLVLEGCRSVVVVGLNYLREPLPPLPQLPRRAKPGHGLISRYARTRDYHRVLENLLRKVARHIDGTIEPGVRTKGYVDYGPVMERPWAQRAGLGFIGKHTLLIHPQQGSFHFLGVLLTTAKLTPSANAVAVRRGCGDCTRCIDACPTGAITEPYRLDARRCLSYLTIEAEGATPRGHWPDFATNIFGCDICQEVCPYNQARAPLAVDSPLGATYVDGEVPLAEWLASAEQFLASMPGASPFSRPGADALRRNAIVVATENGTDSDRELVAEISKDPARPEWLRAMAEEALN
jgi:epoxyqueuosine reductase